MAVAAHSDAHDMAWLLSSLQTARRGRLVMVRGRGTCVLGVYTWSLEGKGGDGERQRGVERWIRGMDFGIWNLGIWYA